jgi:hypothetical protein
MHLFLHPQHAEDEPVCLDRFPKRLRERLAVCRRQSTNLGWGLQLQEGWNSRKTWAVAFTVCGLGSLLFAILWALLEKSVQDAFAVSGWILSFAVVTVGFAQAMIGNLN